MSKVSGWSQRRWITVRRTKKHQDLFTFRDLDVAYADRPCRGAEEGLDRGFEPYRLFEGGTRQQRVLTQPLPLLGEARQAIDGRTNTVDCRVEPGRQQRAHQQWRLVRGDLARIGRSMDLRAQPAGGEVLTLALLGDPGDVWSGALEQIGRASCREKGQISEVDGQSKKK